MDLGTKRKKTSRVVEEMAAWFEWQTFYFLERSGKHRCTEAICPLSVLHGFCC